MDIVTDTSRSIVTRPLTSRFTPVVARAFESLNAIRVLAAVLIGAVSLSSASAAQLVLAWTDNASNESGFKIERSTGGSFSEIATTGANITTYTDTSLAAGTAYTYRVSAYNSAGSSAYTSAVSATTESVVVNTAPTIGDITNRSIDANTNTGAISFTIGDSATTAASLAVTTASSNTTLVPSANIVLGGSGANRTVTVTPAAGQTGAATITVTVSDGSLTASDSFTLTVTTPNAAPTVSDIANVSLTANTDSGAIPFTVGDTQTAAGSLSVTGTSSNTTLLPNSAIVFGGSGANRTVTVTPAANQSGSATVTVNVSDGSLSTSDTFIVTVSVVNTAPTISDISNRTINANSNTGAISFVIGDGQTSLNSLAVSGSSSNSALVSSANIVFGGSGANRTVTVTPNVNQSGNATITVIVSDGSLSASDSFVVTVNAVNTAPTISDIANRSINANSNSGVIAFTVGDAQTAAASLTVTGSSSNTLLLPNANIVFGGSGANRTVTVTPTGSQSGASTVTVNVSDGSLSTSDSFVLTVNVVNTTPTLSDISNRSIDANTTTGALAFTIGDGESSPDSLTVSATSSDATLVPQANIVLGGSGANRSITVIPAQDQAGSAVISVTVSDGRLSVVDTFVVTVNALNTAPTISAIANRTIDANGTTGAISFTVGDAETAVGSLTVTATSSNPTLTPPANIVLGGSGAARTVTVAPATNQTGSATLTVTVNDGHLTTSKSFTVTVNAVITAPTISDIANRTIDASGSTGVINFTVGHATTPASSLVLAGNSTNLALVPTANIVFGGSDANRTVTVTPTPGLTGTATITVVVSDGNVSTSDSFVLTVNAANVAPTISHIGDLSINANDTTGAISFTVGDSATPAANLTVTGFSSNPALLPHSSILFGGSGANRTVTLTPASLQTGSATVTLTVSDGSLTASETLTFTVNAASSAPTITDLLNRTIVMNTTTGAFPFTIGDTDTPVNALTVTSATSNAVLLPLSNIVLGGSGANRTLAVTPAANQTGNATVTITVSDGVRSTSTSFVLGVTQTSNTAPTISDIGNSTIEANTSTGLLAFSINDTETAISSLVVTGSSSNTALLPVSNIAFNGTGANRTVSLSPVGNQAGSATVTVTVSDGSLTASTSFVLTVSAAATAPTITPIVNRSINTNASTGAITFIVGDAQVAAGSLSVSGISSNTTLVPQSNIVLGGSNANRTVTVTPASNQSGAATITLTVSNGTLSTTTTFDLTVNAPNTAPTISAITSQSIEAGQDSGPISFTIGDVQTAANQLTLTGSSSNTNLVPNSGIVLGGSDVNRTVTITPVANQAGSATISVTVSDGSLNTISSFTVTTHVKNTAPTISAITARSTDANRTSAPIIFTVGDSQTAPSSLTLTTASSNPTLVPVADIAVGGSGANRTATITPAANQTGTSTITITVSDGELTASSSFVLAVNVPNSAPTISTIGNRATVVNRNSGEIEFTIGDAETPVGSLTINGASSNTSLLPVTNIVIGGTGANRTVTLTPAANQMGSATVTLTVSDGTLFSSTAFVLNVTASSTAPKISDLPNRTISVNGNTGLSFTVSDAETAAGSLTVTASSQNTVLVPVNNIVFGGSGGNRTVVVTPAADRNGIAVITLTVSDGTLTSSSSFSLVVNMPDNAPVISAIANRSIDANTSTGAIGFILTDPDTQATNLTLNATSSNPTLVAPSDILLGGSLANRTVSVTPAANRTGNAMITITASDGVNSSSRSFQVTVNAVNTPPSISDIANRTITADGSSEVIGFIVADVDTPAGNLTVTASSSNPTLVRNSDIVFSGTGTSRVMTVTPVANQSGVTTITVIVSDGNLSVADSFILTVQTPAPVVGTQPGDDTTNPPANQPNGPTEQPATTATTITLHPQSKVISSGSSTTLEVAAIGSQPLAYQWYAGVRGDISSPIAGATSPTFTTPALTTSASYWVRITSPVDSSSSLTAFITVAAGDRIFFGSVGAPGAGGSFGLLVRNDNSGIFLADASGLPNGVSASGFEINQSGAFSFNVSGLGTVSGQITGETVAGTVGDAGLLFNGTLESSAGATVSLAGLYDGAVMNTSDGEIIALAGSSGRAFVAITQNGIFGGNLASLSSEGSANVALRDGRSVAVVIDPESKRLTGTLASNGKSLPIGGQREDVSAAVRVSNLSVRAHVGQGAGSLVSGFSIGGSGSKKVLVRAAGPALGLFGISDALANPVITVFRQDATSSLVAQNDDWIPGDVSEMSAAMGAFPFPTGSKDAALVLDLPAGGYSAQITGADGSTGTALIEIYDADSAVQNTSRLTNISLRGEAGPGDKVIVTGFNVTGDTPKKVLVRAVGPELALFGLPGVLSNPVLSIFKSIGGGQAEEVATNNDWSSDAAAISQASAQQGAFALTPDSKSSAIVVWLAPGTYTAHAGSGDDSSGVVLVEVYEIP